MGPRSQSCKTIFESIDISFFSESRSYEIEMVTKSESQVTNFINLFSFVAEVMAK